jgi:hypothetical protein
MPPFFAVFLWGLVLLGALAGWGRLLATLLYRSHANKNNLADWLDAPAWGLAVSCLIGGLLNLFSLASFTGIFLYILAGLSLFLIFAIRPLQNLWPRLRSWRPAAADAPALALLALVLLALTLRFSGSLVVDSYHPDLPGFDHLHFNPHDDAHAYLVFPERLLQTGSLGQDPFNSRLMMSGLGAQYFLNAFVLVLFPFDNIHLLEGGVGLAAACLAAAALGLRLQLRRRAALGLSLVPLAVDCLFINTTSQLTGVAVFIALGSALMRLFETPRLPAILLTALLLAAACALKSTFIPTAVCFVAIAAVFQTLATRRPQPLFAVLLVGLVALVCLAPWMLWQYRSSGTPLYPLLGLGGHIEAYHPSPPQAVDPRIADELRRGLVLPSVLFLLVLFSLVWSKTRTLAGLPARVTAAFLLAWIIAWFAVAYSTENIDVARYLSPTRTAGLVLFLAFAWSLGSRLAQSAPLQTPWRVARFTGPVAFALILLGLAPEWTANYFTYLPRDLSAGWHNQIYNWQKATDRVRQMQSAIPPGEKLLAYLQAPFVLDFNRNPVYVADWPGEASPPPGLPVAAGPEPVAAYLLAHGIRYVAYSYHSQANFPRALYANYLAPINGRVVRRTTANAFAFQDDLQQLALTRRILYQDPNDFVLDLAILKPPAP